MPQIPDVAPASDDQDVRLLEAARCGDAKRVHRLLQAQVDPNVRDSNHVTPLVFAAMAGSLDAVRLLLRYGADPKMKDLMGYDAYKTAMLYGDCRGITLPPFDRILEALDGEISSNAPHSRGA